MTRAFSVGLLFLIFLPSTRAQKWLSPGDAVERMPSALQMAHMINKDLDATRVTASYKYGPQDHTNNYKRALNFGARWFNLIHAALVLDDTSATTTIADLTKFADDISVPYMTGNFTDRWEKNAGQKDSLIALLMDLNFRMEDFYDEHPNNSVASLVEIGTVIEYMFAIKHASEGISESRLQIIYAEIQLLAENAKKTLEANEEIDELKGILAGFQSLCTMLKNSENPNLTEEEDMRGENLFLLEPHALKELEGAISEIRFAMDQP